MNMVKSVALVAELINPNDSPKYLNSPETLIFNKRHLLFGLDHAQKSIKENKLQYCC